MILAFLGGIRSGKSALAQKRFEQELGQARLKRPVYLGTLLSAEAANDLGLAQRLDLHRQARPGDWSTVELDGPLSAAVAPLAEAGHDAWLLDGLGAWAAQYLEDPSAALKQLRAFLGAARSIPLCVIVLDEVGLGGVPAHPAARAFADLNGLLNQTVFAGADEAWVLQAGIAQRLK